MSILAFEANSELSCQNGLFFRILSHCELGGVVDDDDDDVPREKFLTQNTKINKLFRKLSCGGISNLLALAVQTFPRIVGAAGARSSSIVYKYLGSQLAVFNHDIYETNLDNDDATNGLHMLESSST